MASPEGVVIAMKVQRGEDVAWRREWLTGDVGYGEGADGGPSAAGTWAGVVPMSRANGPLLQVHYQGCVSLRDPCLAALRTSGERLYCSEAGALSSVRWQGVPRATDRGLTIVLSTSSMVCSASEGGAWTCMCLGDTAKWTGLL